MIFNIFNLKTPLGVSFITFEALSYIFDVANNRECVGNNINILLFISFFPKLACGPIVLWQDFRKECYEERQIVQTSIVECLSIIIIGLFIKVFIADILLNVINNVYEHIDTVSSLTLFITIFANSFYIYFDFLGYSYIAVALSRILGYNINKNFDNPYQAENLKSFWRKWHISLNKWFVNYVYIPLGGNKVYNRNTLIVFLLSGIWHGNHLNFILWGILHGLFMLIDNKITKKHTLLTFVIVSILWVLFRTNSVSNFVMYFKYLFINTGINDFLLYYNYRSIFVIILSFIIVYMPTNIKETIINYLNKRYVLKYALLLIVLIVSFSFVMTNDYSPFLYFGF